MNSLETTFDYFTGTGSNQNTIIGVGVAGSVIMIVSVIAVSIVLLNKRKSR